jgi:hypothetical protein
MLHMLLKKEMQIVRKLAHIAEIGDGEMEENVVLLEDWLLCERVNDSGVQRRGSEGPQLAKDGPPHCDCIVHLRGLSDVPYDSVGEGPVEGAGLRRNESADKGSMRRRDTQIFQSDFFGRFRRSKA